MLAYGTAHFRGIHGPSDSPTFFGFASKLPELVHSNIQNVLCNPISIVVIHFTAMKEMEIDQLLLLKVQSSNPFTTLHRNLSMVKQVQR